MYPPPAYWLIQTKIKCQYCDLRVIRHKTFIQSTKFCKESKNANCGKKNEKKHTQFRESTLDVAGGERIFFISLNQVAQLAVFLSADTLFSETYCGTARAPKVPSHSDRAKAANATSTALTERKESLADDVWSMTENSKPVVWQPHGPLLWQAETLTEISLFLNQFRRKEAEGRGPVFKMEAVIF